MTDCFPAFRFSLTMSYEENAPLVVDVGSYKTRYGFGGDDAPYEERETVIYRPTSCGSPAGVPIGCPDSYFGRTWTAQQKYHFGPFRPYHPVERGMIKDFHDMDLIWHRTLGRADPESPVVLSYAARMPDETCEKIAQTVFESHYLARLCLANSAYLDMYASARTTCVIVGIGHGVTTIVPFVDGRAVSSAVETLPIAGLDLTNYLKEILRNPPKNVDEIVDMKEKLCYVAQDFGAEMEKAASSSDIEKEYVLADGRAISLKDERFRCTEPLFQPALLGCESPGLHELIFSSIVKCKVDIRRTLFRNIVLCGGSSLFNGLADRLTKELTALVPPGMTINIHASDFSTWFGGSVLSSLSSTSWISHEEYDETGPSIIHKKNYLV